MGFIAFSRPDVGDEEIQAVAETIRSGWLTTGPKCAEFELKCKSYLEGLGGHEGLHYLAVNSATSGLHLALIALGVGPGDEVVVPSYTFTATAEVVEYVGAKPVFADVDPNTGNITVDTVKQVVTYRTRALIPVHFAGSSCDMDGLSEYAHSEGLHIVEDAAHAFGATSQGGAVGCTGHSEVAVFSFYANKCMTTGEGGLVVTRDPDLYAVMKSNRLHGIDREVFNRYTANKPSWMYDITSAGQKYNLPDPLAAIGVVQLGKSEYMKGERRDISQRYTEGLESTPLRWVVQDEGSSYHLYPTRVPDGKRDEFIRYMFDHGVGCSVHFIPLHLMTYWREKYSLVPTMFPGAEALFEQEVSLPLYSGMHEAQVQHVIDTARSFYHGA